MEYYVFVCFGNEVINGVMFGMTTIVRGYSIQTYFLFIAMQFSYLKITRQIGGVTFGTPCTIGDIFVKTRNLRKLLERFLERLTKLYAILGNVVFIGCFV